MADIPSPSDRLARLAGKIIDFRLRPPTGPYRTFFTPNVVGATIRPAADIPPSHRARASTYKYRRARIGELY